MDADSKLLKEFLSVLQADAARLAHEVSSLGHAQATSMNSSRCISFSEYVKGYIFSLAYVSRLKSHNAPLKLLVENELYRLSVWANPMNDSKRGVDYLTSLERSITDVCFFLAFPCNGITGNVIGGLEEHYTSSLGD
jgi:phosphatidylinositol 4-kinase